MPKVAVLTDSISCLPREFIDRFDIEIIPINLFFGGKLYRDGVDLSPSEAYEFFLKEPESFKTSAPPPRECLESFRRAGRIARNLLFVTVSNKLSMVHASAAEARELARNELPDLRIEIMDSLTATSAEGFVTLAAARAAAEDKDMETVITAAARVRDRVEALVLLDTIKHVYRSGRIPRIASQVGSILQIRPLLSVHESVHFAGAVRNREQGIKRLIDITRVKLGDSPAHVCVMHAYAREEAENLMRLVSREFNCVELWLSEFSPIMGYACGTGTLGLASYAENGG